MEEPEGKVDSPAKREFLASPPAAKVDQGFSHKSLHGEVEHA